LKRDVACGGDISIDNNSRGDISDNWDASVKVISMLALILECLGAFDLEK
jgi:hypothetical protein